MADGSKEGGGGGGAAATAIPMMSGGLGITYAPPAPISKFDNYKGILLCDRPSDGSSKVQSQSGLNAKHSAPFLPPGSVEDPVSGLQPSAEFLKRKEDAKKNFTHKKQINSAQQAHRKMLRGLEEEKMKQRLDLAESQLETEVRKQHFREAQTKIRQPLRGDPARSQGNADVSTAAAVAATLSKQDPRKTLGLVDTLSESSSHHQAQAAGSESEDDEGGGGDAGNEENILPPAAAAGRRHTPPLPEIPPPPVSYVKAAAAAAGAEEDTKSVTSTSSKGGKPKAKAAKSKPKPKWAMTEEEALEAELKDTGDLVNFAENLDFEKYINDYEIKEAISIMRQRVEELKAEKDEGEGGEEPGEEEGEPSSTTAGGHPRKGGDNAPPQRRPSNASKGASHKLSAADLQNNGSEGKDPQDLLREREWDNVSTYSALSERKRLALSNEAMGLAERILATGSPNLRAVYSKASLARVLEELTRKAYNDDQNQSKQQPPAASGKPSGGGGGGDSSLAAVAGSRDPAGHATLVVAQQDPQDAHRTGGRVLLQLKNSRDYVQNLPYLYRCPSI